MKISKWWGSERRKEFLMKISEINKIIKDELRKNRDSSVNYKNYLSSFHIPFEMRTNVMNYRYSISGLLAFILVIQYLHVGKKCIALHWTIWL